MSRGPRSRRSCSGRLQVEPNARETGQPAPSARCSPASEINGMQQQRSRDRLQRQQRVHGRRPLRRLRHLCRHGHLRAGGCPDRSPAPRAAPPGPTRCPGAPRAESSIARYADWRSQAHDSHRPPTRRQFLEESPVGRREGVMVQGEIFVDAARSAGDLAGVFEFDGQTGYFYLYRLRGEGQKVLGAIHVVSGDPDFGERDIAIRWNPTEGKVGLFIKGELWAAFDAIRQAKYGGNYEPGVKPGLPLEVRRDFAPLA